MTYTSYRGGELIKRDSDGLTVPNDANNRDRIAYQAWLDAGNSPTVAIPPIPTYRDRRQKAYIGLNAVDGLGVDEGDAIRTIGDVLDVVITELAARGASQTANFADLLAKIAVIKTTYPKQ